jgi:alkylation response protein AidB-like acyl-CoA dehydrogenase
MDLTLTDRHRALRQEVQAFIRTHAQDSPKPGGGRKRPDRKTLDWQKLLVEHGYAARSVPHDYGGFGAEPDVLDLAVIADAFSRANLYQGLTNQGISMLVPTLLEVGTEAQRRQWIGPTIRGEVIWCQGYSEPGSGSDLAAASTRAVPDGDDFVVNGQKIWTSSAHYADMMFLLCRTEPDLPKHEGLSYLLLSMRTPGIEVRPLKTMTGRNEFNEVFFTDVRVPAKQIVLGRGKGWYVANITLKHERLMIGDAGKLTHRLEQLITLLQSTSVEGRRLIDMAEFRDRLLKLQGEVLAWRAHNLRLLTEAAKGEESGVKRMIVKYGGTMLGFRLSSLAVDALGAAGLPFESLGEAAEDDDATTWNIDYMYDVGLMIGGGSNNIQKNIIGERGLGLPREPKAQPSTAQPSKVQSSKATTVAAIGRG